MDIKQEPESDEDTDSGSNNIVEIESHEVKIEFEKQPDNYRLDKNEKYNKELVVSDQEQRVSCSYAIVKVEKQELKIEYEKELEIEHSELNYKCKKEFVSDERISGTSDIKVIEKHELEVEFKKEAVTDEESDNGASDIVKIGKCAVKECKRETESCTKQIQHKTGFISDSEARVGVEEDNCMKTRDVDVENKCKKSVKKTQILECKYCKKTLCSAYYLKIHEKNHMGEWNKECSVCGKKFFNESSLKMHQRSHTGEKPFECGVCGKKFLHRISLKQHEPSHSKGKQFECAICGNQYLYPSSLNQHIVLHYNERPGQGLQPPVGPVMNNEMTINSYMTMESPASRKRRLGRERVKRYRAQRTQEQLAVQRFRNSQAMRAKRIHLSPEQRASRNAVSAQRMAARRANLTPEELSVQRSKNSLAMAARRTTTPPEYLLTNWSAKV